MKTTTIRLHAIAMYLEKKVKELGFNVEYKVKNVYSDFGLGTTHETIVVSDENENTKFQIFSPAELSRIENDEFRPNDADNIVKNHSELFDKWNVSKVN